MSSITAGSAASPRRDSTRLLLWAAVAVPFAYYGTLLVASLFYPGYSHATQYASELGSASATYPMIFNGGVLACGALAILGAIGLFRALRARGVGTALAGVFALTLVAWGVGVLFAAIYPMPDERHGGYGLTMGIQLSPLLLLVALRKATDLRALKWVLAVNTVAIIVMFAIMWGVGGLVTRANVGLFQRAYSLTVTPWIAIAAWSLLRWLPGRRA